MACLARPSFKLSLRAVIRPGRQIHSTPVVFKKKKSKAVADDLGDEEWGDVEDLIPVAPISATSTPTPSNPTPTRTAPPAAVVASTSASASTTKPSISRHAKDIRKRLPEAERIKRFQALVDFVTPRVGRHPTLTTPLVRRTAFPVLMQLATNAKHMQTITTLMASWKEGRLGTQGKARFGPDGQPKGAEPFIEATSELFARRCEELGCPELTLTVFGTYSTYALPLTLPAARRMLHGLITAKRPLTDVTTATALYASHNLPPVYKDLPSCALLLSACLKHLETLEGKKRKDAEELVEALVPELRKRLARSKPMANSRDVRDKTLRGWLKGVLTEVDAFLRAKGQPRMWLEVWMVRSRFVPSPSVA